jgi:hypothetical protein
MHTGNGHTDFPWWQNLPEHLWTDLDEKSLITPVDQYPFHQENGRFRHDWQFLFRTKRAHTPWYVTGAALGNSLSSRINTLHTKFSRQLFGRNSTVTVHDHNHRLLLPVGAVSI